MGGGTDTAREVAPGRFRVTWVRERLQSAEPAGVRLATFNVADGDAGADPLSVSNELVMGLDSPAQPRVRRLICGEHRATGPHLPPTRDDIDAALGAYGRLATPTG